MVQGISASCQDGVTGPNLSSCLKQIEDPPKIEEKMVSDIGKEGAKDCDP